MFIANPSENHMVCTLWKWRHLCMTPYLSSQKEVMMTTECATQQSQCQMAVLSFKYLPMELGAVLLRWQSNCRCDIYT